MFIYRNLVKENGIEKIKFIKFTPEIYSVEIKEKTSEVIGTVFCFCCTLVISNACLKGENILLFTFENKKIYNIEIDIILFLKKLNYT